MHTPALTKQSYPGGFGAEISPFTFDAPDDWTRLWHPQTLGGLDASSGAGIPASPFRPNLVIQATRVPGDLTLQELVRQILDGVLFEHPGLRIDDEVVTELGGRTAVRRTQTISVDDPAGAVRQTLVFCLSSLPGVDERELFQLTASFDAEHTGILQPIFDDLLASFAFKGAEPA